MRKSISRVRNFKLRTSLPPSRCCGLSPFDRALAARPPVRRRRSPFRATSTFLPPPSFGRLTASADRGQRKPIAQENRVDQHHLLQGRKLGKLKVSRSSEQKQLRGGEKIAPPKMSSCSFFQSFPRSLGGGRSSPSDFFIPILILYLCWTPQMSGTCLSEHRSL